MSPEPPWTFVSPHAISLLVSCLPAAGQRAKVLGPVVLGPMVLSLIMLGLIMLGSMVLGPMELDATEMGHTELGLTKLGPTELGPTKLGPMELGFTVLGPMVLGPMVLVPTVLELQAAENGPQPSRCLHGKGQQDKIQCPRKGVCRRAMWSGLPKPSWEPIAVNRVFFFTSIAVCGGGR